MSGFYVLPVGIRPMSSWSSHQRRNPKSSEPGTDFYCPIGTPVKAPEAGRIYAIGDSITPATGRWVGIDFDDGRRFRVLHLQRRTVSPGQRVSRSQIIGYSGASGYGKEDWSADPNTGGAHVHVTLWPDQRMLFGYRLVDGKSVPYTIDFYPHAGAQPAGGGSTPFPTPEPIPIKKRKKDMGVIIERKDHPSKHTYYIEAGFAKHLASPAEVQAMKWAIDDDTRYFDELDFQRAVWGFGLEEFSLNDFTYIAGGNGAPRPGGYLVATWRNAGKVGRAVDELTP